MTKTNLYHQPAHSRLLAFPPIPPYGIRAVIYPV